MTRRGGAESVCVKRRRPSIAARRNHPRAIARTAMTHGAVDVVPLLPSVQYLGRDRKRERSSELTVDFSSIDVRVDRMLAARNGPGDPGTRGHAIGEEVARLQWIVARLVGHLLAATAKGERRKAKGESDDDEERDTFAFRLSPFAFLIAFTTRVHRRSPLD
jgi:hypothetical protein